jgi:FkbM family methyltransferase
LDSVRIRDQASLFDFYSESESPLSMDHPRRSLFECVRQFTRGLVPQGGYAAFSLAFDWSCAFRKLGWHQSRQLWRAHPGHKRGHIAPWASLSSPNLSHPFFVRTATTDASEFLYTVVRETYGRYLPQGSVEFILDAGANIGDTAVWFLTRFCAAKLIAVEPDPENFAILQRNCAPYGQRSLLVRAAVWPNATRLSLDGNQAKDAVEVRESPDGDCSGLTVPQLMKMHNFPRLDILKCDIEGAEKQLFLHNADDWLSLTKFVVIETHGEECLNAVLHATARHGFTHREFRNLHIFAH